jgi:predicted  nucleic acid-binding Zn-ribbon protein
MQLTDKKLVALLKEKDSLVTSGREVSKQIEKIEYEIKKLEDKEKAITLKVEPKELMKKSKELQDKINTLIADFEKVADDIKKEKLKAIPADIEKKHKDLLKEKENKERERNKIALKIQKIKDKAIPMIRKEVLPHLKEFEDIETAEIKGDVVEIKFFSHLEDWKKSFLKRTP